jgi:hypothetical protein
MARLCLAGDSPCICIAGECPSPIGNIDCIQFSEALHEECGLSRLGAVGWRGRYSGSVEFGLNCYNDSRNVVYLPWPLFYRAEKCLRLG